MIVTIRQHVSALRLHYMAQYYGVLGEELSWELTASSCSCSFLAMSASSSVGTKSPSRTNYNILCTVICNQPHTHVKISHDCTEYSEVVEIRRDGSWMAGERDDNLSGNQYDYDPLQPPWVLHSAHELSSLILMIQDHSVLILSTQRGRPGAAALRGRILCSRAPTGACTPCY